MKRIVTTLIVVFLLLICPFFVTAYEAEELPGQELADELLNSTPDSAKRLADRLGIDEITPETLLSLEPTAFFSLGLEYVKENISQPIKSLAAVIIAIILCAVADAFRPNSEGTLNGVFSVVSALAVLAVLVTTTIECIKKVCTVASDFSEFMTGYVPVFASAITASGQTISGGVYTGFMFLVCQIIASIASNFLLPMLTIYLAISLVCSINPSLRLNTIADTFKNCVNKTLGFSLTVFVGMMSLQSLVAAGSDNIAVKAGKYLIGNFVPVVGSAISEVFLSVQGYMKLMKTCIGWYGIVAAVLIFLPILLETTVWRVAVHIAKLFSETLNVPSVTAVLNAIGSVFTMLIAFVLTFALLLIVTTTIMLATGMG